jgi:hypothetical protein
MLKHTNYLSQSAEIVLPESSELIRGYNTAEKPQFHITGRLLVQNDVETTTMSLKVP